MGLHLGDKKEEEGRIKIHEDLVTGHFI